MFKKIPKSVKIKPDLNPFEILSKNNKQILIGMTGEEVGKMKEKLLVKTIIGSLKTFDMEILLVAEVKKLPLKFSALNVQFRTM